MYKLIFLFSKMFSSKCKIQYLFWSLSFLLILLSLSLTNTLDDIKSNFRTDKQIYKVYDNFINEYEDSFLLRADNLSILKELLAWEENNNDIDYIICNTQAIQFEQHFSNKFSIGYGLLDELGSEDIERQYNSLQVNENFFSNNMLKLDDGRGFETNDYIFKENESIPIILGTEYRDYLNINQETDLYYMGIKWKVKVIGFLSDNCVAKIDNEIVNLNRYLIMPSLYFDFEPINEFDKIVQLRVYLDKTQGYMLSQYTGNYLLKKLQNECIRLDIQPYGILGVKNDIWGIWGAEEEQLRIVCTAFELVVSSMIIIYITLTNILLINNNKRTIAILIMNGFYRWKISLAFAIIHLCKILISYLAAIVLDYIFFQNMECYLMLMIVAIVLGTISLVGPICIVNKIDISVSIGGQRHGNIIS